MAAGQEAGIEALGWLAGCWERRTANGSVEEVWMAPRGGSMLGMSRSVRNDRLSGHELMVVSERDGALWYRAYPSGQPSAEFRATRIGPGVLTVENPDHDFPRRIEYRAQPPDSLLAWIDGGPAEPGRRIEFRYARVTCDA